MVLCRPLCPRHSACMYCRWAFPTPSPLHAALYFAGLLLEWAGRLSLPERRPCPLLARSVVLPPLRLGTYALQSFTYSDSQHPEENPVKANFVEIFAATDYVPQVRACAHALRPRCWCRKCKLQNSLELPSDMPLPCLPAACSGS